MWLLAYLGLFVFFSLLLIRSTDIVIGGIKRLMFTTHTGVYGLASFLLAFSTTLPETFVGVAAAIEGRSSFALGNSLGSNIANLSFILGLASLLSGSVAAKDSFIKRDVFYAFMAGALPLLMMIDGQLSRIDGVLLIAIYWLYNISILKRSRQRLAAEELAEEPVWRRIWVKISQPTMEKNMVHLLVGLALLVFSAEMMVKTAEAITDILQVPAFLVGLFIISIGTSLPELAFEIKAIRKHEAQMAFGGITGSVVSNSTWVLGLVSVIQPIKLAKGFDSFVLATVAFVLVFLLFWYSVWTKKRLERWEGAALVLFYLLFVALEFLRTSNYS